MKTQMIMYFIVSNDVEYCVLFKPYQFQRPFDDESEWDVTVARYNPVSVLDLVGCEFYFRSRHPSIVDAHTFLRMSLPVLVEQ